MWLAGLIVGALLGASFGWSGGWLFFGALGLLIGLLFSDRRRRAETLVTAAALEKRIEALEREMRELRGTPAPAAMEAPVAAVVEARGVAAAARAPEAVDTHTAATPDAQLESPRPAVAPAEPGWQKLFGGNILAKVGVVLLFFGIASGMKLAINYGLFPPAVRLLLATVAGIAMIGFGLARTGEARHRMFALVLQGGGFAVLYLVTYFALAWYGYIGPVAAFAIFAALGVACLGAAIRVEGEPLAILGIAGAFLAPLLASTGRGDHIVLFSYYAVLDLLVIGVYWLRLWRVLTVTALSFTLGVGMSWALGRFTPDAYATTQAFLIVFAVLFSLVPFLAAASRRPANHWAETLLTFGTPVATAIAQNWLVHEMGYADVTLAWAAVAAGLYYSALAAVLYARGAESSERFAHSAIAVAFYTVSVPLAFDVQVTSAFWALEGLALAWYGLRNRSAYACAAGMLLQIVAGAFFFAHWQAPRVLAVLNGTYVGYLIIAGCGAATALLTRRATAWPDKQVVVLVSNLLGLWALAWWLGANFSEVHQFVAARHRAGVGISIIVVTVWGLAGIGRARGWPEARHAAMFLTLAALVAGLWEGWLVSAEAHPLHDTMVFAMPAAFSTAYLLLRLHERDGLRVALPQLHVIVLMLLALSGIAEALWLAETLAPAVYLWRLLSWQVVPAALVCLVVYLDRHAAWPVASHRRAYLIAAAPILLTVAMLAALNANFTHPGSGSVLPYAPFASFFDLGQIVVIGSFMLWSTRARDMIRADLLPLARGAAPALAFVWLSAMAMRIAYHWGSVPFNAAALMASGIAQSMLSLLWTALALVLMIGATRKALRARWFLGFALLGIVGAKFILVDVVNKGTIAWTLSLIGVGLLILAASYFSPAPPRAPARVSGGMV